ncbi:diguanylate cyclase domain-containing protein [Pelatocladus sp. BLCC-F211]|uniref:diguanylate cyclase domain-containing protein n=1 Tax=Pelatocladus sp. BLCC-F211 TaxID=3342752 RepID=UPI0035B993BB
MRLASVDSLTQIANRYYFDEYLQREWNRLQKYQLSLSLILLDVKLIKADYEYLSLDQYLCQITDILRKCKQRGSNLLARFDERQFAMILPNTQAEAALQIADVIFSAVKATDTTDNDSKSDELFSFSLGLTSVIPSSGISANQLISTAEKALSQAKLSASDRIVFLTQD